MAFSFTKKLLKKNLFHLLKRRYWNIKYKNKLSIERFISLPFGKVLVRMNEDVGGNIYSENTHEAAETNFLSKNVKEDWTCIDIGANIGYFSLLLASKASNGTVIAIEPIEKNIEIIKKTILENNVKNIFLEAAAIDSKDGYREFAILEDSAYSGFISTGRRGLKEKVSVRTVTPGSIVSKHGLTRIDLIKIDIEGSEMPIFESFKDVIMTMKPKYILSECNESNMQNYGFNVEDFLMLLESYGYNPNFLSNDGDIYDFDISELNQLDNIIFTRT